jgi:hypothetical protein
MANAVKSVPKKGTQKKAPVSEPEVQLTGIVITREMFKRDYALVSKTGTCKLSVGNVSQELSVLDGEGEQVISNRPGSEGQPLFKRIVNLRAVTFENAQEVKNLFDENPEGVDLAHLNGLTLSANTQPYPEGKLTQELPMRGEKIKCNIGYVVAGKRNKNHKEGENILAVTAWQAQPAIDAPAFDLDAEIVLEMEEEQVS